MLNKHKAIQSQSQKKIFGGVIKKSPALDRNCFSSDRVLLFLLLLFSVAGVFGTL